MAIQISYQHYGNGKGSFYKSEKTWVYNGKAIPSWVEITEAEFNQIAASGIEPESSSSF